MQMWKLRLRDESKKEPRVFQSQMLGIYCAWNAPGEMVSATCAKQMSNICHARN